MGKTIAIIQPHYLPWLGYFDMIDQVDAFVFLDTVQRVRQSWHHRNRIRNAPLRSASSSVAATAEDGSGTAIGSDKGTGAAQGWCWLTLPLSRNEPLSRTLREATIAPGKWATQHARSFEVAYRRARHWAMYGERLLSALLSRGGEERLVEVTIPLTEHLAGLLGIQTPFVRASDLDVEHVERVDYLVSICEVLGADAYLSPIGALTYLQDSEGFGEGGISLRFHHYEHPVYSQRFDGFISHLSAIDLLMNEGPESMRLIRSGRRDALTPSQAAQRWPAQTHDHAIGFGC